MIILGFLKNINFSVKTFVPTFWQLLKILGFFLFQHLVTLYVIITLARGCGDINWHQFEISIYLIHSLSSRPLAGCRSLLEAFVSFSTVSLLATVPRTIPARPGVAFNLDPVIALQSQRATSQSQRRRRRRRAVFLISFAVLRSSYSSSFCTLNFIDIC